MNKTPQPSEVRAWAATRLSELEQERTALLHLFPGLSAQAPSRLSTGDAPGAARLRRRRGNMSAAARKAVSQRMKQYWAERRKQKAAGAKKAATKA